MLVSIDNDSIISASSYLLWHSMLLYNRHSEVCGNVVCCVMASPYCAEGKREVQCIAGGLKLGHPHWREQLHRRRRLQLGPRNATQQLGPVGKTLAWT